jgi:DNA end-binding protein Ku
MAAVSADELIEAASSVPADPTMPPRSLRSATLSFGLVTIPVRFYTATSSQSPHFHLIHEQCGSRIKQQLFCPTCGRVVERDELVRGYEGRGHTEHNGQYVLFTDEELRALETAASPALDIAEFVPLDKIDPTYFESTYYLGPDKAGEKAYRLLVETMTDTGLAAIIQFVWRGKENVAAVRAQDGTLVLHTLFFADEVRDAKELGSPQADVRDAELRLAKRLVDELRVDEFEPTKYHDAFRERLEKAAQEKAEGRTLEIGEPAPARAPVIDLMEALQESLRKPSAKAASPDAASAARPASKARKNRKQGAA